jgi:hypothetical protein
MLLTGVFVIPVIGVLPFSKLFEVINDTVTFLAVPAAAPCSLQVQIVALPGMSGCTGPTTAPSALDICAAVSNAQALMFIGTSLWKQGEHSSPDLKIRRGFD